MARTYQAPGLVLQHTAAATISAGDPIKMGDTLGIALSDAVSGDVISVSVEGVHEVVKVAGTAWTQGAKVDYDASASGFNIGITPAAGDVSDAGVAALAAASAATVGYLKLTPGAGTGS